MAPQRPDRGYAWIVVFSCAYANFAMFGLFRSAGVLYVALINEYHITREEASWPFTLCSAIFQLIGPFASILLQFISLRKLALLGSVIATVGVVCCFFATSVVWVNIWYGVIHGVGFGLVVICVPVIINQYFIRHRATAMGCSFAGSTMSSFVLPPLIEYLQQEYGLRGSFLILSGLAMNSIVACTFLRPPPWLQGNRQTKESQPPGKLVTGEEEDSGLSTSEGSSCKEDAEPGCRNNERISEVCKILLTTDEDGQENNNKYAGVSVAILNHEMDRPLYDLKGEDDPEKEEMLANKEKQISIIPRDTAARKPTTKAWSAIWASIVETVSHPMFFILTISTIVFFLNSFTLFIVIVDFAKDKGIPEIDAIYLLPVFSLTDLLGRVAFGWVTDSNYISRKNMFVTDITMIGVLSLLYPHCYGFVWFSLILMIHGLAVGSGLTIIYVLQAEYFGLENQVYFCGLGGLLGGLTTLCRPPLIGLFRDQIGSYDWMFRSFGILSLLMAAVWLVEPCLHRKAKQRAKGSHDRESNIITK